ncbi:hypothetical protein NQ314_001397 [Rhamnusium bicolor]|uniref:tRNA pseudouridine(55) synthase n=1 Tax=Rhamnusium bicolor TaxID=1586634 RepID=A0AAV8ZS13_9CUCU|nr:hypothetical protein NQ314_001397 [Rhamnusium bicolor]
MPIDTLQEKIEIINCLKELDCCSRCIIRLLEVTGDNPYLEPENYLNTFYEDEKAKVLSIYPSKRIKRNPCRICLDIFQNYMIEKFVECIASTNINEYKYSDFQIYVSFPKSVIIRNHSMVIYLKEKFPNVNISLNDMENFNKVFRLYEDEEVEIQNIKKLNYMKKSKGKNTSKNVIMEILDICEDKVFKDQFSVPPKIPHKEPFAIVHCNAKIIWIGGRYLKFSRDMGQTPWLINNKLMTKHCLQDILFESMEKNIRFSPDILQTDKEKLTLCASGREDADVRMLGDGRPFYVQIDDPKDRSITYEQFRAIEKEVFNSKVAAVINLQNVCKEDLKRIKEGEQHKRKHYNALCQTDAIDMNQVVSIINTYKNAPLEIHQKTPLRVLHRRSQSVRMKYIYSIEAKLVPGYSDLIEVSFVTQAGTYVKEFVHGDFHRTNPSLSTIIDHPIDVVALDVTKIELNWPEEEITNAE